MRGAGEGFNRDTRPDTANRPPLGGGHSEDMAVKLASFAGGFQTPSDTQSDAGASR